MGLLQGSILSPALYSLFIDELAAELQSNTALKLRGHKTKSWTRIAPTHTISAPCVY